MPRRRAPIAPALVIAAAALSASCGRPGGPGTPADDVHEGLLLSEGAAPIEPGRTIDPVVARTVYVPIYSHIYLDDPRAVFPLAATLSVRNTDPTRPIILSSIRYFDTDGRLVREYLKRPIRLAPLATIEVVVRERDLTGGSGANFLVDWSAGRPASRPVIQSVMIGSAGNQGISFLCEGSEVVPMAADPGP